MRLSKKRFQFLICRLKTEGHSKAVIKDQWPNRGGRGDTQKKAKKESRIITNHWIVSLFAAHRLKSVRLAV
jgi:hypothetical protein